MCIVYRFFKCFNTKKDIPPQQDKIFTLVFGYIEDTADCVRSLPRESFPASLSACSDQIFALLSMRTDRLLLDGVWRDVRLQIRFRP